MRLSFVLMPVSLINGMRNRERRFMSITCCLSQTSLNMARVLGRIFPFFTGSQTDLFLYSDLYVYTECNNAGKQLRPPNTLC